MGSGNSVDREAYLKLLDLMNVSEEDINFELDKELEFLKNMRKKDKTKALGSY